MNSREYPEHKTSTFSYEKLSTYLEKEKQTLEKILKILAKIRMKKNFFSMNFCLHSKRLEKFGRTHEISGQVITMLLNS